MIPLRHLMLFARCCTYFVSRTDSSYSPLVMMCAPKLMMASSSIAIYQRREAVPYTWLSYNQRRRAQTRAASVLVRLFRFLLVEELQHC